MRERPILFNDAMVRAILDGRKTQTRRPIVPQPPEHFESPALSRGKWTVCDNRPPDVLDVYPLRCPFGEPGDLLWVKECFAPLGDVLTEIIGRSRVYRADADLVSDDSGDRRGWWLGETFIDDDGRAVRPFKWTPSIHMPRWAARIFLRVTSVRVERLQDITEEDARAEGCVEIGGAWFPGEWHGFPGLAHARDAFAELWDVLAKPGTQWDDNPWIWVIEFERVIAELESREKAARPMSHAVMTLDRCDRCGWPMAADGCAPGDCSYRPADGSSEWRRMADGEEVAE